MSRLPNKWVNQLLGAGSPSGIYLAPKAMAMAISDANGDIKKIEKAEFMDIASALQASLTSLNNATPEHQVNYAQLALASNYFDTYVLSFQEFPNNKTEQLALIHWTLSNRKLANDNQGSESTLRYQLMGKTKKGYKVLIEILHQDIADIINEAMLSAGILAETTSRASHWVYNHLHQAEAVSTPGALVFYEDDTVSAYFWNENGVLSFYRDYSLTGSSAHSLIEVANDVISIVRRLESSEWGEPASCIYTSASSFSPHAKPELFDSIAEHCPTKQVNELNTKNMMLKLVRGSIS